MKYAGLLGYPLKHSVSPQLHGKLCRHMDEPMEYKFYEIPLENLSSSMDKLKALDGFNVTIPHKLNIKKYLDELDESAKKHGAVNVVAKQKGRYIGYNTDCIGFVRAMESANIPIAGKVCVVGIGGAGRMFATECAYRGCQLFLAVRKEKLERFCNGEETALTALQRELSIISGKEVNVICSEEINEELDLLINASPVGMYPKMEAMPVNGEALSHVKAIFDCIYNPKETLLMKTAKEMGCRVCGGMPMLVWQAVAAQEIWYGKRFTQEQVQQVLSEMEEVL